MLTGNSERHSDREPVKQESGLTTGNPYARSKSLRDTGDLIAKARARLDRLPEIKRSFAVVRMWPDQAVAEHENVERLRTAAELIGARVIEVDRHGRVLSSPGSLITDRQVDFVLHLHFETAKLYHVTSVAAMWNPLSFYVDWGFDIYWPNQMSHNLFAFTGDSDVRDLVELERGSDFVRRMPTLNHSLAEPIYSPRPRDHLYVFYCGINWEKINGKAGRHDNVLRALDAAGRLALYGPEKVQGVRVWDNYACYRGSLPFDGRTVIDRIAEAGACLVFSSDAHKASNIMSNRLFEALAGGAVVIGDEHPFIRQAIGEDYICVPANWPDEQRVATILGMLHDFERNPEHAVEKAQRSQDRLLEKFFLCTQLADLFESVDAFRTDRAVRLAAALAPAVDVIVQPLNARASTIRAKLAELADAFGARANVIVLCSSRYLDWYRAEFGDKYAIVEVDGLDEKEILGPGDAARAADQAIRSSKLWFSFLREEVFSEEIVAAAAGAGTRAVTRLGHALRHADEQGVEHLDYRPGDYQLERLSEIAWSACLFDAAWLRDRVRLSGMTWQQCAKAAELEEQGIAFNQSTAVILDLKRFEDAQVAGYAQRRVASAGLETRVAAIRTHLSDEVGVKTYQLIPSSYDLQPGERLAFQQENATALSSIMGIGWSGLEATHVWSVGSQSEIFLQLPITASRLLFEISGNPHVADGHQRISVFVNDEQVDLLHSDNGSRHELTIDCSSAPWRGGSVNRVRFNPDPATRPPADTGDERQLGCCLWEVKVV